MPPPKVPSRPNSEYHIGWITALSLELTAARTMLDEIHEPPPAPNSSDHNTYCLGRIGEHNVAIACLPECGNNAAAVAAEQMLHTFRSIRFGLMVGVGGGVPSSQKDIRLGDVVVSTPNDTFGGVVQYDMGKEVIDNKIRRTGSLDRPPQALLTALAVVRSNHELGDTNIPQIIQEAQSNYPKISTNYASPGPDHDILFEDDYDHKGQSSSCDQCDFSRLIQRSARLSNVPLIYYGTIGSGNCISRNGLTRSKLAKELGMLCFETEAAGLMNHFRCLVIRGICDYADSHNSKEWQRYAAMTAAAYAKELLLVIPAQHVRLGQTILQVTDPELHEISNAIVSATTQQHKEINKQYNEERRSKCHQIQKTSDYETYKNVNPSTSRDLVDGFWTMTTIGPG